MGLLFRLCKNELFSLSTIFLVMIPLITSHGDLSKTPLAGVPAMMQSASLPDLNGGIGGLMQMIGQTEASAVTSTFAGHGFGGGHRPVFLPADAS